MFLSCNCVSQIVSVPCIAIVLRCVAMVLVCNVVTMCHISSLMLSTLQIAKVFDIAMWQFYEVIFHYLLTYF